MLNHRYVWFLRLLGCVALLGVAADHLYEYFGDGYSVVPTIGTLFLLDGFGAIVLALGLIAPWGRLLPAGLAAKALSAVAIAGIGLAAGSLAGLFIAESTPLFGFMEFGYRLVIVLAIIAEGATILALGALLATRITLVHMAVPTPRPA